MEEKNIEKDLTKIIEEVNANFSGKLLCGCSPGEEQLLEIYEDAKYIEFIGAFRYKAKSMKELKPLFDYIEKNNYKTNLE